MGWWGHGIYDGDGPQDALYSIGVRVFGRERFRDMLDKRDDANILAVLHENVSAVRKHLKKVVAGAIKDASKSWTWGGAANLIAVASALNEMGIKPSGAEFKRSLRIAFELEYCGASLFNSPSARRDALKKAARQLNIK